jgi:hypothetical protein
LQAICLKNLLPKELIKYFIKSKLSINDPTCRFPKKAAFNRPTLPEDRKPAKEGNAYIMRVYYARHY